MFLWRNKKNNPRIITEGLVKEYVVIILWYFTPVLH